MNQSEFLDRYEIEKPILHAWGEYINNSVTQELLSCGIDLSEFLKIPVNVRIKDNTSIIAKAFLRKEKHYSNPYEQITDKVVIRFVVLELSEIAIINGRRSVIFAGA